MTVFTKNSLILVVEDDDNLRLALTDNLESEGYDVLSTRTAEKARQYMSNYNVDLVVLDIMLPDDTGINLCAQWREQGIRSMVLMLTALDDEDSVVHSFEAGADDYIVKPYQLQVFLLRVKALIRRLSEIRGNASTDAIELKGFVIDQAGRKVTSKQSDLDVPLTKHEYNLLIYFLKNKNSALTYNMIMDDVWGGKVYVVQGAIRNTVSSLRKKLDADNQDEWQIVTLRGIGYRFEYS